jgi:signal transduction histidine kinase
VDIDANTTPLYVDRYRIQTALFNIIQNSLEAMQEDGCISISAQTSQESRTVAIKIEDTGAGMPADMIDKVCEPFFSTHKEEGMRGLGLAIVRDIVKSHGGTMDIKSSPGAGTAVTLYLPISDDQ